MSKHVLNTTTRRRSGDGKVGPVCLALTSLLEIDAAADSADQHQPLL